MEVVYHIFWKDEQKKRGNFIIFCSRQRSGRRSTTKNSDRDEERTKRGHLRLRVECFRIYSLDCLRVERTSQQYTHKNIFETKNSARTISHSSVQIFIYCFFNAMDCFLNFVFCISSCWFFSSDKCPYWVSGYRASGQQSAQTFLDSEKETDLDF